MVEAFGIEAFAIAGRWKPAYYSPAMEAARPGGRRRRSRRGTVDRPLNARLVRVSAILVVPALLAFLFSISPTGPLPRFSLAPVFDPNAAARLAAELTTEYPSRIPGSPGAEEAAGWYRTTVATFGLRTQQDVWYESLPDLGRVELRNLVTVIPGRSQQAIVLVAHRDNAGVDSPFGNNASGTAALIELARGFAPQETSPTPRPQRTLVLVSTDAGAYGGAGAARFAAESPYAHGALAAVVLDGLGGPGRPRIAIAGDTPHSPAPTLVRTAAARIREQSGVQPALPGVPTQLVDLGIPYATGEQGQLIAKGIAAVTMTTDDPGDPNVPAGDPAGPVSVTSLGQLGRAAEAVVDSIDSSVGSPLSTRDSIFIGGRVGSGWAARLTLVVAVVPFALAALDLIVRSRRRGLPLRPAVRALRARLLFWLFAGVLVWFAGVVGVLPTGAPLPLPPYSSAVMDWPVAGLSLLAVVLVLVWLVGRRRLLPATRVDPDERLAGYAVALGWLAVVAILVAVGSPYTLVFVLPSLYAWLWLPVRARMWTRTLLYLLGLAGPVAGVVVLANELGLSYPQTLLYIADLVTVGYIAPLTVLLSLAWAAAAAQLAALAFGRYGPYAGGREPPPPGVIRSGIGRLGRRTYRRRYASER